jgi:hypothetical protein
MYWGILALMGLFRIQKLLDTAIEFGGMNSQKKNLIDRNKSKNYRRNEVKYHT